MSSELRVPRPDRGVLFVVSGPSGVGKSTLLRDVLAAVPDLSFSVSATTRAPRRGEVDGEDYHFLTDEAFRERIAAGAFLEHAEVYDRRYGTLAAPTERVLAAGRSLLLDIDVVGARNLRQSKPEAVFVMVVPPSIDALEARLRARGTDDDAVIARRMELVQGQLGALGEFDYLVVNDHLPTARATFLGIVLAEMSRTRRLSSWVSRFSSLP
jgi:guanylate kinase